VVSVNSAADAVTAARNGGPGCSRGTVWADLNSASPGGKRQVAVELPDGVGFVDVALMSTVPGKGLRVPMAASGPAAAAFAELIAPLGAEVDVVGEQIGEAATRKLLRSVFFKGLAAAVTESLAAARAAGLEERTWEEIARELTDADAGTVTRLVEGSKAHAVRRAAEMAAAVELLGELGVPARVSTASRDWLHDLAAEADHPSRG
jgi:3-hydroxyisobutyrate dehydrogenase-like beta-hydroxyacid dehydrogenase